MNLSASTDGMLLYASGTASGTEILTWFDRSGKRLGTVGEQGEFYDLDLSPDEKRVVTTELNTSYRNHLGPRPGKQSEDTTHLQRRRAPHSALVSGRKRGGVHLEPAGRDLG